MDSVRERGCATQQKIEVEHAIPEIAPEPFEGEEDHYCCRNSCCRNNKGGDALHQMSPRQGQVSASNEQQRQQRCESDRQQEQNRPDRDVETEPKQQTG